MHPEMTVVPAQRDPMRGPRRVIVVLLILIAVFLTGALVWAQQVELDISAAGIGRVIPSSQVQTVQNLEGGIVTEMTVREGDRVTAGQIVARIDDTGLASSFREDLSTFLRLSASAARLRAEADGGVPGFPAEVVQSDGGAGLMAAERALFDSRRQGLEDVIAVLRQEMAQARSAEANAKMRARHLRRRLEITRQERAIVAPQVARGVVSTVERLKLDRQIAEIEEQLTMLRGSAEAAVLARSEAAAKISQRRSAFVSEAFEELNRVRIELAALKEKLVAHRDRVTRRNVRSPVNGIVKRVAVTTAGAVIRPGDPIMEIVPVDDALLIEARVNPRDIAFIRRDQTAQVRITAYDFSVYGALPGRVERVGADSIVTQEGESFYPVIVRVDYTQLPERDQLPIIPGMIADVSIVTGTRTVLDYMLKPIYKLKEKALTER